MAEAGVDYGKIDLVKVLGQRLGAETARNIGWSGVNPNELCRGGSAYHFKLPAGYMAHVEETLGTKQEVAQVYYELTGDPKGYHCIALDTLGMIFNDLITVGIPPISVQMHLAAGSSDWFDDHTRIENLMRGWKEGCDIASTLWTGGETPALKGTVMPDRAVLSGSAVGFLPEGMGQPYVDNIKPGDHIIGISSNGIHANGISPVRKIASTLPKDEIIELYRQTLQPTHIYVELIHRMILSDIVPSYALNLTGHGYMKLMRSCQKFTYRVRNLMAAQQIFGMIQEYKKLGNKEMFSGYNMGTGFVFVADPKTALSIISKAKQLKYDALDMGVVEEPVDGKSRVILEPVDVVFEEEEMNLR